MTYSNQFNKIQPTKTLLYHYTDLRAGLEHILPTARLRLSPLGQTNDPRETKDWLPGLGTTDPDATDEKFYLRIKDEFNDRMKKYCRVASFSQDDPEADGQIPGRNGYALSRMWAQYGEQHRGLCILFDKEVLLKIAERELQPLGRFWASGMTYSNATFQVRKEGPLYIRHVDSQSVDAHLVRHWENLFFRKRTDWRDEQEFRLLIYSSNQIGDYLYLPIEKAVIGIIVGVDFPESYYCSVREMCRKLRISGDHIQWNAGDPFLAHPIYDREYEEQQIRAI